jgi:hypothetical protein
MMHPDISLENGRERVRDMLATADRRRAARQVRALTRAARYAPGRAGRDSRGSRARGLRGLAKVLPRGVW